MNNSFYTQSRLLLKLNRSIQFNNFMFEYHIKHIKLTRKYALLLNKKLNSPVDPIKLSFSALAHDLFKERGLDERMDGMIYYDGHDIPQDLNRYVRMNLDILDEFDLTDFFNTDIQLHALAAGIFLIKEYGITDKEILYPIFFHSCPIISVYQKLDDKIKTAVDIIMLSDKLSSNYLRINYRESLVRVDLDKVVFSDSGIEFNYTLGLYIARLLAQGKTPDRQSKLSTEYYFKRLQELNPLISNNNKVKRLGVSKKWPLRKSQAWNTH